jgi:bis(5'-nucleosyl)-tetraphosphatase (symmetrical)
LATYAIGDVQGCAQSLDALLAQIAFDPASDCAWFAGDLVNRGATSLPALRRIIGLGDAARVILGNHDLHLLARFAGAPRRAGDTLQPILDAPDAADLVDWVRRQPLALHADGHLLIHAGLAPSWTVEETLRRAEAISADLRSDDWRHRLAEGSRKSRRSDRLGEDVAWLTRARLVTADGAQAPGFKGSPEDAPPGTQPWYMQSRVVQDGEAIVLFGHWAALGFRRGHHWVSLDSGCVWGRRLTAYRLDDGAVFDVPADPLDLKGN